METSNTVELSTLDVIETVVVDGLIFAAIILAIVLIVKHNKHRRPQPGHAKRLNEVQHAEPPSNWHHNRPGLAQALHAGSPYPVTALGHVALSSMSTDDESYDDPDDDGLYDDPNEEGAT